MNLQVFLPRRKVLGQMRLVIADLTGRWGQNLKALGFTPLRPRGHYMIKSDLVRYDDRLHYDLGKLLEEANGRAPRDLRAEIIRRDNEWAEQITRERLNRQRYGAGREHA